MVASLLINGGTMFYIDDTQSTITAGNATIEGVFTVVSQQSTTGFTTVDYNVWPFLAKSVIIAVMFIGGRLDCGGIKVVRVWITSASSASAHACHESGRGAADPHLKAGTEPEQMIAQ